MNKLEAISLMEKWNECLEFLRNNQEGNIRWQDKVITDFVKSYEPAIIQRMLVTAEESIGSFSYFCVLKKDVKVSNEEYDKLSEDFLTYLQKTLLKKHTCLFMNTMKI